MLNPQNIEKTLSSLSNLERELNLKQLQINKLLNITQAINNNLAADALYSMYHSFLSWELGVKKMALYTKHDEDWIVATAIGMDADLLHNAPQKEFVHLDRTQTLDNNDTAFYSAFDLVIPVLHKKEPIAYAFIGDCAEESKEFYEKIQLITAITNIIAVAIENKRLFKQQLQQERFKKELELASDMQQMMVPAILPSEEKFSLDSIYIPQIGVGGDYFDYIRVSEDRHVFCVADISGKGFAAALLMSNFQANLRTLVGRVAHMKDLVMELNQVIFEVTKGDKYITLFLADYHVKSRQLTYVNAGHVAPLLYQNKEVEYLKEGCMILGAFEKLPFVDVGERHISEEALLLTFTDGLTDLQNEKDDYFDEACVEKYFLANTSLEAPAFNRGLLKELDVFKNQMAYPDDITVLTCKIK